MRPGEISLAHRGILFFDELPEFQRVTLEALRQPLEERTISIARSKDSVEYPANFIFVATANRCPCGNTGTKSKCHCLQYEKMRYLHKLSGPILDRIDLYSMVKEIEHDKLLTQAADPRSDDAVRQRILNARVIQAKRFMSSTKLNNDMTNSDIRQFACLRPNASKTLNKAAHNLDISARSYMRTIKVARTIADLEASPEITKAHLAEAFRYRSHAIKDQL